MLGKGTEKKNESEPPRPNMISHLTPSGLTGIGKSSNAQSTDSNDFTRVLDGDLFNAKCPPTVPNPMVSIPGMGVDGALKSLDLSKDMLSTHLAMIGGIGTGKSTTFNHLISQISKNITQQDIIIIFDTKGDFYKTFGKTGDIVISNDSRASGENGVDYWNIFEEIDPDDVEGSIREICSTLFKSSIEKSSNAFFPQAASDVLFALIDIFYEKWQKQSGSRPTNYDLVNFIQRSDSTRILTTLKSKPQFSSIASHISDPKSGQTQGVIAEMNAVVNKIFVGNFRKKGTLSMNKMVKEKKGLTVFIEYDVKNGELLTPIYSLLVDLALKQALSNKVENDGSSVYLFIDEFKLLPNLSHIDDAVNFGRSLGMKVFIALQSITQMFDIYGENKAKSILSGFLNYMFFNVNNYESREFIKERFGKCLRRVIYGKEKDYIYEDYVVKDKDITRLQVGEAIIGLPNSEPFKFRPTIFTR